MPTSDRTDSREITRAEFIAALAQRRSREPWGHMDAIDAPL